MNIETLTTFFMWGFIINAGFLLFVSFFMFVMPDFIYRMQKMFIPISRENFDLAMYSFMGLIKALMFVFFLVPWLALLIMG